MEQIIRETPVASFIFLITILTSIYAFNNPEIYGKFMLHPYSVSRGHRVYALITSGLIHADWMHLIFNMLSFYFFAFMLENEIGHWQFGVLYLASLALADISTILKHKEDFRYNTLGASGAVSAVIFSFILFYPMSTISVYFIPMPAIVFAVLYLVYSAYAAKQSSHINHDAHLYGALAGLAITIIFYPGIVPYFFSQLKAGF